jgi:hypothetical protein
MPPIAKTAAADTSSRRAAQITPLLLKMLSTEIWVSARREIDRMKAKKEDPLGSPPLLPHRLGICDAGHTYPFSVEAISVAEPT